MKPMILILLLLFVFLITALAIPQKVLGFIKTSNGIRRLIAVLIFLSVIGGFFFYAMWSWNQYQNEREEQLAAIPIEQYLDSIKQVYPNYLDNEAVFKKIVADFEQWLGTDIPGKLEGEPMEIFGSLMEIGGVYKVSFVSRGNAHIIVTDEDFGEEKAAQLDTRKTYKITGGKFVGYTEPIMGIASLDFGRIYVEGLTVEEMDY